MYPLERVLICAPKKVTVPSGSVVSEYSSPYVAIGGGVKSHNSKSSMYLLVVAYLRASCSSFRDIRSSIKELSSAYKQRLFAGEDCLEYFLNMYWKR